MGCAPRPQGQGASEAYNIYLIYIMKNQQKHHWSKKYKRSIDCSKPKGFSQRQHCNYGRTKTGRIINKRREGNKTIKKRK